MRVVDPLGPTDIDPDDARDRACDVTSSNRVCEPSTPDDDQPPVDNLDPPDVSGGAGVFGWLLVVLLVAVLVVAIVWLISQWLDGSSGDDGEGDEESGDVDEVVDEAVDARIVDRETPPDRWRRLATEAREANDFREAIRCEYRALVGDLARAGYVDEIPGRTSGEEREQVAEVAPRLGETGRDVAHQFASAADTFDAAWFDDRPVSPEQDRIFLAAERSVLDVVLSGAGKRAGRRGDES